MSLLREIQKAALDSSVNLPDLLRKCKVLAARLKHREFADWIGRELNGYSRDDDLPAYRQVKVQSFGDFAGPFGSSMKNAPIPIALVPAEFRHLAQEQNFDEPVASLYEVVSQSKATSQTNLHGKWPGDMIAYMQHRAQMYEHMVLVDAWRLIPASTINGILDTVRTRILDFALAIEEEDPAAGDVAPGADPPIEKERVNTIYHTVINGGQAMIGTRGHSTLKGNVSIGSVAEKDKSKLNSLLPKLRQETEAIENAADRDEATDALAKVEQQLAHANSDPVRLKKYVELYAAIVATISPTLHTFQDILSRIV